MKEDNRNTEINALNVIGRRDKLWYSFSPQGGGGGAGERENIHTLQISEA